MQLERTRRRIHSREEWLKWREKNIGASDVAALFGQHPYVTPLKLWAWHRGEAARDTQDNAAMRRGRIFERAVLSAYQEEHPDLYLQPGEEYHEIPSLRMGATPDAWAVETGGEPELVQIKTVTPGKFENEWQDGPTLSYLMQLQTEMLVCNAKRGRLVVMVMDGFNLPIHEYCYEALPQYQQAVHRAAVEFWGRVIDGAQPDALAGDCDILQQLHPQHTPDSTIALGGMPRIRDAIDRLKKAQHAMGQQNKIVEAAKAEICAALGNHERGVLPGWTINWPTVRESFVPGYTRKAHRRLTISKERGQTP